MTTRTFLLCCLASLGVARAAAPAPAAAAEAACPAAAVPPPAVGSSLPELTCADDDAACWKRGCAAGVPHACAVAGDPARACDLGWASACSELAAGAPEEKQLPLLERACVLGSARACESAAERHERRGREGADPCYVAFLERGCALRDRRACALAKLCATPPSAAGPIPGRDVVEGFLQARSSAAVRAFLDESLVRRALALSTLADPRGLDELNLGADPASVEATVEAFLASPDEGEWPVASQRDCALRPGTADDREELAPIVYFAAASEKTRALVVETRARLDVAVPVVAACRCDPEQAFLVDVARRKIVAHRVRALPPRTALLLPAGRSGPPVSLRIETDAAGATLTSKGRSEPLPWRRDELRAYDAVKGTIQAPGREPYALDRAPADPRTMRGPADEVSWFVVLRRAAAARK